MKKLNLGTLMPCGPPPLRDGEVSLYSVKIAPSGRWDACRQAGSRPLPQLQGLPHSVQVFWV